MTQCLKNNSPLHSSQSSNKFVINNPKEEVAEVACNNMAVEEIEVVVSEVVEEEWVEWEEITKTITKEEVVWTIVEEEDLIKEVVAEAQISKQ